MAVPEIRGPYRRRKHLFLVRGAIACALVLACAGVRARADEIRLKDGKKLYGVIVAYEDNMFKVKTDFGFVLVEKDKIAAIIPTTPAATKPDAEARAKPETTPAAAKVKAEQAKRDKAPEPSAAAAKTVLKAAAPAQAEKLAADAHEPEHAKAESSRTNAPKKTEPAAAKAEPAPVAVAAAPPAAPPKAPELPENVEKIEGNQYINVTHKFSMYKAPSWDLLEDARRALPNAIVAMGTLDESTLLVVGQEKTKDSFAPAAAAVERRLHEVYENYRRLSQKTTSVGGLPAIEYQYRGEADGHDWSGTLVVISRNGEIFTVLGMTYADTDLIQIQENVIARAISSLNFNAQVN